MTALLILAAILLVAGSALALYGAFRIPAQADAAGRVLPGRRAR